MKYVLLGVGSALSGRYEMNKLFEEWMNAGMDWNQSNLVIQHLDSAETNEQKMYSWKPVYKIRQEMGDELAIPVIRRKKEAGDSWYLPNPDHPEIEDSCSSVDVRNGKVLLLVIKYIHKWNVTLLQELALVKMFALHDETELRRTAVTTTTERSNQDPTPQQANHRPAAPKSKPADNKALTTSQKVRKQFSAFQGYITECRGLIKKVADFGLSHS